MAVKINDLDSRGQVQISPSSKAAANLVRGAYGRVREHGKWARTPLAAFFNMPIMAMPIAVRCEAVSVNFDVFNTPLTKIDD